MQDVLAGSDSHEANRGRLVDHRVVAGRRDEHPRPHPGVHVAPDVEDAVARERLPHRHALQRQRDVEHRLAPTEHVGVVGGRVRVDHLQRARPGHNLELGHEPSVDASNAMRRRGVGIGPRRNEAGSLQIHDQGPRSDDRDAQAQVGEPAVGVPGRCRKQIRQHDHGERDDAQSQHRHRHGMGQGRSESVRGPGDLRGFRRPRPRSRPCIAIEALQQQAIQESQHHRLRTQPWRTNIVAADTRRADGGAGGPPPARGGVAMTEGIDFSAASASWRDESIGGMHGPRACRGVGEMTRRPPLARSACVALAGTAC